MYKGRKEEQSNLAVIARICGAAQEKVSCGGQAKRSAYINGYWGPFPIGAPHLRLLLAIDQTVLFCVAPSRTCRQTAGATLDFLIACRRRKRLLLFTQNNVAKISIYSLFFVYLYDQQQIPFIFPLSLSLFSLLADRIQINSIRSSSVLVALDFVQKI